MRSVRKSVFFNFWFTIRFSSDRVRSLDPKDIEKTTFNIDNNSQEFKTKVYMDDIIVYSSFLEEYNECLIEIFKRPIHANLTLADK